MRTERPCIYLAAPLFNDRERQFNVTLTHALEDYADVFLPQRNGALLVELIAKGVALSVAEQKVFEQDCAAMSQADLLIAVLDGGHIDEGVAFEIGFMCAQGKICIGLQTDIRRALPTGNNPMISQGLCGIFSSVQEVVKCVESYVKTGTYRRSSAIDVA